MTAISYHDTVKDVQGLPFAGRGPFTRVEWFTMLEDSGARPLIALARRDEAALALPLTRRANALAALTNWYAFTWEPLASGHCDELAASLARDLASQSGELVLDKLPPPDADRWQAAFRAAGWIVLRDVCDTNRILPVAGRSYAEYLAARPGKLRTTLKRKAKRVDITIATRFDPAIWAAYEAIYAESWKPEEGDPALLRRFAEAEGAAGRIRLACARHEGEAVAAQFWTVESGVAYIHKLAHRESARPHSPGTTLTAALMEHAIDRDHVELVDFGTGDDPYKADWMEAARPRYRLHCLRPGSPRNWPKIARHAARKLVSRRRAG